MISLSSVGAILSRLIPTFKRDFNLLFSTFYWVFFDIIFWGFLGVWLQQSQAVPTHDYYKVATLLSVLLWQFIARGCHVILMAFIEELWFHNIVNLFSLPLRIGEWIAGIILFTAFVMAIVLIFGTATIYFVYNVPLIFFIKTLLTFCLPLFFSALWTGFTCLSIIVLIGKRGIELGYMIVWTLLPFSGVYYPVEVLPQWIQHISAWLPLNYVFLGMRRFLMHQEDPTAYLTKAYALSIAYAICAIALFVYCFNRSKIKGLSRLVD